MPQITAINSIESQNVMHGAPSRDNSTYYRTIINKNR
ncbi:Uncharacterised protein [Salmonella enterica subsp. diarizonae]|uniref:Uncharacterized protein n=1 Tax=Salmonella diarizonae TaxID=59204 RepID=A0A379U297_SALDZ|nr:Uncharacterised protein [Salmonella enterica subsp. diarizonae]